MRRAWEGSDSPKMKPVAFDYVRPASVAEACALLAADDGARIIAGGQTLIPMLAMRLARPARLVDIGRISEMAYIREDGDGVTIGAVTRQCIAERDPIVGARLPLLAKALPWVGHPPTRHRGTVGGSIANADPAAEIPLVAVTLNGTIAVQDVSGSSAFPAGDFHVGPMITTLPERAIVTGIRFPVWSKGRIGTGFHEVSARRSDFAFVAAAAQVALDDAGRCLALAVGIGGAGDTPVRLEAVGDALIGSRLEETAVREALAAAVADLETVDDLHASAAYRKRVAATLARRAILEARDEAAGASHAR
jgi:CO/xanthine dehydrogenase FAD-binding subunit